MTIDERIACLMKFWRAFFRVKCHWIRRHPALAEALAGDEAELDCGLVEPASVFGCVVHPEAAPEVIGLSGTSGNDIPDQQGRRS